MKPLRRNSVRSALAILAWQFSLFLVTITWYLFFVPLFRSNEFSSIQDFFILSTVALWAIWAAHKQINSRFFNGRQFIEVRVG